MGISRIFWQETGKRVLSRLEQNLLPSGSRRALGSLGRPGLDLRVFPLLSRKRKKPGVKGPQLFWSFHFFFPWFFTGLAFLFGTGKTFGLPWVFLWSPVPLLGPGRAQGPLVDRSPEPVLGPVEAGFPSGQRV